jgi:hypothetical protein
MVTKHHKTLIQMSVLHAFSKPKSGKTCTTDSEGKATLKLQQGEYRLSVEGYEFSSGYDGYVAEFDNEEYYVLNVYGNALKIITLRKN